MGNNGFHGFSHPRTSYNRIPEFTSYPIKYANLLMWLSADAIPDLNDGDLITSWVDNSGHATVGQSNATYKPAYKTNIVGSRPVARFTYGNYFTVSSLTIGSDISFMVVWLNCVQSNTTSSHKPLLAGITDPYVAGNASWGFGARKQGLEGLFVGQGTPNVAYSYAVTNLFEVGSFVKVGGSGNASLFRNGLLMSSGSISGAGGATNGYWIGGQTSDSTRRYQGDIAEMLVWSVSLTDDERAYMERSLMGKYGISA